MSTEPTPEPTAPSTDRLDRVLVSRGLARSRGVAQELIREGLVTIGGHGASKPSQPVGPAQVIDVVHSRTQWVGRGAEKLHAAVSEWPEFAAQIDGARCIDVGASTGGFTQVLLRHGALQVVSLDVGTGQLAPAIADEPRVVELSGTHVLKVNAAQVRAPFDVVVADLSFISLTLVLPHVATWCTPQASMVLLVKPQFEVGRDALGRGGIVRSIRARTAALVAVVDTAYNNGVCLRGAIASPMTGTHGNHEYLIWVSPTRPGMMDRAAALTVIRATTAQDALAAGEALT